MKKCIVFAAAAALFSGGLALAAQQGAAVKKLLLRNPPSGNKKLIILVKNATGTIVGNPNQHGSSLNILLTPGGSQCIGIPPGGNEHWSTTPQGFKYRDAVLEDGPVKTALIKVTPSGKFFLKVNAQGPGVTVDPGDPTAAYAINFMINIGGDEYCASSGSASPTKNDEKTFLVKNDDGTACVIPACSSPSGAFLDTSSPF